MRTPRNVVHGTPILILTALMVLSPLASGQQAQEPIPEIETSQRQEDKGTVADNERPREDYYRAEFVILERRVKPGDINERMASRIPEPPSPDIEEVLRAVGRDGGAETTMELVNRDELHLNSAANRLENSGRYRVLLATGWYQSFPPDFEGEPLRVAIGDWLEDAGHREIEGQITVDRQRYLHVGVELNHWQPRPREDRPDNVIVGGLSVDQQADSEDSNADSAEEPADPDSALNSEREDAPDNGRALETFTGPDQSLISGINWPRAELVTWIRETRRMRSEEVHFLDSPTIGVLVFFKKIEE